MHVKTGYRYVNIMNPRENNAGFIQIRFRLHYRTSKQIQTNYYGNEKQTLERPFEKIFTLVYC